RTLLGTRRRGGEPAPSAPPTRHLSPVPPQTSLRRQAHRPLAHPKPRQTRIPHPTPQPHPSRTPSTIRTTTQRVGRGGKRMAERWKKRKKTFVTQANKPYAKNSSI